MSSRARPPVLALTTADMEDDSYILVGFRRTVFHPKFVINARKDAQRRSMSRFTAMSVERDEQNLSQILIDMDTETAGSSHIKVFDYGPFQAYRLETPRAEIGVDGAGTELNVQPESTFSEEVAEITRQDSWSEGADQALECWDFTVIDADQFPNTCAPQDQFPSLVIPLSFDNIEPSLTQHQE
jgi:hypothetical protein